ncbi:MAG TPA: arginine deiminase family protein [Actinomycetota bacterium]|nr:arginine deiminase family protein [Actinomycetota bacterium]
MPIQDQTSALRRVYVRPPEPEAGRRWREYGWRAEPDPARAAAEHEAFLSHLADAGADVVVGTSPADPHPDAIYTYDPVLMTDAGSILLRPAKPGRRGEPEVAAADLAVAGIPTIAALDGPGFAEGGDLCWLHERTLLAGVGYRTNSAGVTALRKVLVEFGVEVIAFDLPHLTGPSACTHLLSFFSLLDDDLAVASLPHLPVRLVELFRERSIRIVEVPPDEFDSMGPNVLALAPRIALALAGNPETRRRMEAAGVDVRTYEGEEISRNGGGGPTCLTRPLDRG